MTLHDRLHRGCKFAGCERGARATTSGVLFAFCQQHTERLFEPEWVRRARKGRLPSKDLTAA